jgi:hypothetical protein
MKVNVIILRNSTLLILLLYRPIFINEKNSKFCNKSVMKNKINFPNIKLLEHIVFTIIKRRLKNYKKNWRLHLLFAICYLLNSSNEHFIMSDLVISFSIAKFFSGGSFIT